MTSWTVGVVIVVSSVLLGPYTSLAQEKNSPKVMIQALRLLGKGTPTGYEGCHSFVDLDKTSDSVAKIIAGKSLAEVLIPTLKNTSETCPNFMVSLVVSSTPPLAALRDILGSEDSAERDNIVIREKDPFDPPLPKNSMEVTWYKYGALHFGVIDGKVRLLRAYTRPPTSSPQR